MADWFEWEFGRGASFGYDRGFVEWGDSGFETPEAAAVFGFPPRYVRIVEVRYHPDRDHAIVELLTNEEPRWYPWTAVCGRDPSGRWHELDGRGG